MRSIVLYLALTTLLVGCDNGAADLKEFSYRTQCSGEGANRECAKTDISYACIIRRPLFFTDVTIAHCKEEKDCRAACDKYREENK